MYILGLATMGESAAALIKDGELVAAVEEERFTRVKHDGRFPVNAIAYCLDSAGITLADVDHVAVFWQPWRMWRRAAGLAGTAVRRPGAFVRKLRHVRSEFSAHSAQDGEGETSGSWGELFRVRRRLTDRFGPLKAEVHFLDHHETHIASTFHVSPFDEATIIVIDGAGEEYSTTLAVGSGKDVRILKQVAWPESLGHFYSAMTGYLGFRMLDGEYKMMGLAPYNEPTFADFLKDKVLRATGDGGFRLDTRLLDYHDAWRGRFHPDLIEVLGPPRKNDDEEFNERHQRIAASAQRAFEDTVLDMARWAYEAGGRKANLCIAGGCGLNCTANGRLLREGPFDKIFVPPAPHDAGAAVGAAFALLHGKLGQPRRYVMRHAYYGPSFDDARLRQAMAEKGVRHGDALAEDVLVDRVATALSEGRLVAWFQGRAEFGPRALGNRSYLADPRNDSIRDTINAKIKKRELFRPFAPSVKEERAEDFFEVGQASPFMNLIGPVKADKRDQVPAITHVDGTARVQTVSRETNPRYWALLDRFEQITGVPVLLNTSFNIQEPIVCTPEEALNTFMRSEVDYLILGDYVIDRAMLPDGAGAATAA